MHGLPLARSGLEQVDPECPLRRDTPQSTQDAMPIAGSQLCNIRRGGEAEIS